MLNTEKLYELMQEKEISTLSGLSRCSGIAYTTLQYMVDGHDFYVGTVLELSKFFNVPLDYMINKPYGVHIVSENHEKFLNTTNLVEAIVSTDMCWCQEISEK